MQVTKTTRRPRDGQTSLSIADLIAQLGGRDGMERKHARTKLVRMGWRHIALSARNGRAPAQKLTSVAVSLAPPADQFSPSG